MVGDAAPLARPRHAEIDAFRETVSTETTTVSEIEKGKSVWSLGD